VVFVDSNIFVIDLRYPRDRHRRANQRFLRRLADRGDGATTLVNLLEVAGILSFNLNRRQLRELLVHFPTRYRVRVLPSLGEGASGIDAAVDRLVGIIERRCSLGDALVIEQLEAVAPAGSVFVTWDAHHFDGKLELPVADPTEFLRGEKL
jgi:predicted nucleic acid-binding protein